MSFDDCYFNGALVPLASVRICPEDGGLLRGEGLFETLRVSGGIALEVDAHLKRLYAGLALLGIAIPEKANALGAAVEQLAAATEGPGRLRITITTGEPQAGPTRLITVAPYEPPTAAQYRAGVHAITARDLRLDSQRPLRALKSTSYLVHRLIGGQASAVGAFDALVFNERDRLVEGGRANILLEIDQCWVTPPCADGCLPGTVRRRLLEGGWVQERSLDRRALVAAGAAAFTNSLIGVLPIARIDGRPLRVGQSVSELRQRLPGPWSRA